MKGNLEFYNALFFTLMQSDYAFFRFMPGGFDYLGDNIY